MRLLKTLLLLVLFLSFAFSSFGKNYGVFDVKPKGTLSFNGQEMLIRWRYSALFELVKNAKEHSEANSYSISGLMNSQKGGKMNASIKVIKKSPTSTRIEAEFDEVDITDWCRPEPYFEMHLAIDAFDGRVFADGKMIELISSSFRAKEFVVQTELGELKVVGELNISIEESIRQKVIKYATVKMYAKNLGEKKYSLNLDFSYDKNKKPSPLRDEVVIKESDDYKPIQVYRTIEKGSALDFSFLLDVPAGKYGFVKAKGGNFIFEKAPEKKVRFYGSNICQTATKASDSEIMSMVEQFATSGFNTARLHQTSFILRGAKDDSATLNQRNMRQFDLLFAELKKRGIYMTMDFYGSGKFYKSDYDDVKYRGENMKTLIFFSPKARATFKRFISNFLNHKNQFTGIAYKDEPALVFASVVNEDSIATAHNFVVRSHLDRDIVMPIFEKWKIQNAEKINGKDKGFVWQLFLVEKYNEFYAEMKAYIKNIAPNLLLTDQTNGHNMLKNSMANMYDIVDSHSYTGHPIFYTGRFAKPYYVRPVDAIKDYGGRIMGVPQKSLYYKPSCITEWDYVRPNKTSALGGLLVSSYASLNGIDGIWHFCYTHHSKHIQTNVPLSTFESAGDAVRTLSMKMGSLIHLRRDIAESKISFPIIMNADMLSYGSTETAYKVATYASKLALVGKVGGVINESGKCRLPKNASAILYDNKKSVPANCKKNAYDAFDDSAFATIVKDENLGKGKVDLEADTFLSSTGEIFLDAKNGSWKAVSERTEAFAQYEGKSLSGDFAKIKNVRGWSATVLSAIDGNPLASSKRIVIALITNQMNTNQVLGKKDFSVFLNTGTLPYLLLRADVDIEITSPLQNFKCYALDTTGKRLGEIEIVRNCETAKLSLSTHSKYGQTIAFELVEQK